MQPKVLLVGNDEALLRTRAMLFAKDAEVIAAHGLSSLCEADFRDAALVVLCHTLSLSEERAAIEIARKASAHAMILILLLPGRPIELPEHASAAVSDGPEQLLTASWDLIDRWRNS